LTGCVFVNNIRGKLHALQWEEDTMQELNPKTLGQVIAQARKAKGLTLREAAALIHKEDENSITHQYLSELENDRRLPSDKVAEELVKVLGISRNYIYLLMRRIPSDFPAAKSAQQADDIFTDIKKRLEEPAAA
jgi:transcriptional regulator with XRE-family HTH domain